MYPEIRKHWSKFSSLFQKYSNLNPDEDVQDEFSHLLFQIWEDGYEQALKDLKGAEKNGNDNGEIGSESSKKRSRKGQSRRNKIRKNKDRSLSSERD